VPFERKKTEDAGDIMLVVAVVVGAASLLFKVLPESRNRGRAVRLPAWCWFRCRVDVKRVEGGRVVAAACYIAGSPAGCRSARRLCSPSPSQRRGQRQQPLFPSAGAWCLHTRCVLRAYHAAPGPFKPQPETTSSRHLLPALQWQLGGWCALICTLQAIANMKTKDWDIKQVISAMT
jgi:Uncharacterised protein family (UPF0139)